MVNPRGKAGNTEEEEGGSVGQNLWQQNTVMDSNLDWDIIILDLNAGPALRSLWRRTRLLSFVPAFRKLSVLIATLLFIFRLHE